MGEAHFGAVDEAIAEGFEEDERLVVSGVEDDLLEFILGRWRVSGFATSDGLLWLSDRPVLPVGRPCCWW